MKSVVFDTNALLMPAEHGVDVFDEVERLVGGFRGVVPEEVANEVESLGVRGANVAREMLDLCTVVEVDADDVEYADDAVVSAAEDADAAVTNDSELKNRLLKAGVPVIHLRGDNRLGVTRP